MKTPLWMVLALLCLPGLPLTAQSREIECGTDSSQRVTCAAGGEVASARLVNDLSSRCGPAGTWGWSGRTLWADNGCRGRFEVSYVGATDSALTRRITCGSITTRRYECSTEGRVDSVRLVKRSTFARCTQGTNWGYSDSLIWAGGGCRAEFAVFYRRAAAPPAAAKAVLDTVSCGKTSGELHTCATEGPVDTVRLVRDLSTTACRQKFNWDYARGFVWARSGCRGMFEVTYEDTVAADTATRRIICGSYSGTPVNCRTEGHATEVRLVQDLASTRCREGTNWGHSDSLIWADKGCRGEFEVTYRRTPPPGTRRITCGSASAIQVQCATGGMASQVKVVRNLGTSECRQGLNWKFTSSEILAVRGCRAEFEVTLGGAAAPGMKPTTPAATKVVTCGNASGAAMSCNAFGTVATVRLQRDRSGGRCGQSSSWGLSDGSIWVARGCYGDFELTYAESTLK